TIDNGIDLGNNEGVIINDITPRVLYWVGGTGNWSETEHWSTVEGQTPGTECPPNIRDDIFFSDQSGLGDGNKVTIDVKYACSNDQTWSLTSSAALEGSDTNNIRIWGSMEYSADMESVFGGNYYFESEHDFLPDGETPDPEMINFAGKEVFKQCHFYGNEGAWTLLGDVTNMIDTLFFTMGNLNTNGQTVTSFNFFSGDTLNRILSLGTSLVEVHQKKADAWTLCDLNLDFFCGTSTIRSMADKPFLAPGEMPNEGHVRSTYAEDLTYWNIEINGERSILKSEGLCHYNLVDFLQIAKEGEIIGPGSINILTFHEGADFCVLKGTYDVNLVNAFALDDGIEGEPTHNVVEAHFFQRGYVKGYNWFGQLFFHDEGDILLENTIDYAIYEHDGYIHGENTFGTLIFTPSYKYFLEHGKTQTITGLFDVNGTCLEPIWVKSDLIGSQANIEIQYSGPSIDYTSIRDINAIDYNGNTPYTAYHSIDLGNNTNWNFEDQPTETLYWIGGQGNWGDPLHWSLESGGPPFNCIPRELNNVVFDDNSFQTVGDSVLVELPNISCKDMLWYNSEAFSPIFHSELDSTDIYIYGDLYLSPYMGSAFNNPIHFEYLNTGSKEESKITSNGIELQHNIIFNGIGGEWRLMDNLQLITQETTPDTIGAIVLENGKFVSDGHQIMCSSLWSDFDNERDLDINGSEVFINIKADEKKGWMVDASNLLLDAENSTITVSEGGITMINKNGEYLKFNDIILNGTNDILQNSNNITEYNIVEINEGGGSVNGNYIADTIYLNGAGSGMLNTSQTNVVIVNGAWSYVGYGDSHHQIKRCFANEKAYIYGINEIEYCIFQLDGKFLGENIFDTLVLLPAFSNTFTFEAQKTQTVLDVLQMRGNNCYPLNIKSSSPSKSALIKVDNRIVHCYRLNLGNVSVTGENSEFYAGITSVYDEEQATPTGWIMESEQGYVFGLADEASFCEGEEYVISATNFNGDQNALYYWDYSSLPGNKYYTVSSPGTYHVRVEYSLSDCVLEGDIVVTVDYPPDLNIVPGPYCEGDKIPVEVSPPGEFYLYEWSDGTYGSYATASPDHEELSLIVTNTTSGCDSDTELSLVVHETPKPEDYIADDVILHFGETLDLDAGPGDTYLWQTDNTSYTIPNPNEQYITGFGSVDTATYTVLVTNLVAGFTDGCTAEAEVKIAMYERPGIGIPTAFSPNGDAINDKLEIKHQAISQLNFVVYDRYGKIVFETNDPEISWDGNISGHRQNKEVYTYYLKASFIDGADEIEQTGNITLLR
ncbi:MAG: hypothetical protein DRJ05_05340, partial [Bacteroidetes bacterium]